MIKIDIKGMDELIGKVNRLNKLAEVRVADQVRKSANKIRKAAKVRVPVETGALKKSIRAKYSKDKLSAVIGPQGKVGWRAHFVEFGTTETQAQPYMVPAWEENRSDYIDGIKKALNQAVDQA